ncbi:MAG: zinc-ribbon domain-containing protein, partial [Chromatiales bacterium]|nr:zinc-ribbon domain-containing protein [Chromatiales bacterium]
MFTQCPNCQTTFRINAEQLRVAQGKARCSQCNQVFNALDQFADNAEETTSWPESRFVDSTDIDSGPPPFASQPGGEHETPTATPDSRFPLDVPDLLSELDYTPGNDLQQETSPQSSSTDPASPPHDQTLDTSFSDYLAKLEKRAHTVDEPDSTPPPSGRQQDLLDSFDIDEDSDFELPMLEEPGPEEHDPEEPGPLAQTVILDDMVDSDWPINEPSALVTSDSSPTDTIDNSPDELADDLEQITPQSLEVIDEDEELTDVFIDIGSSDKRITIEELTDQTGKQSDDTQEPHWPEEPLATDAEEDNEIPFQLDENVPEIEPTEGEALS